MAMRVLALVCCAVLAAGSAHAVDLQGRLTTLVYSQERFDVNGDDTQVPLFQFVTLDAENLGNPDLSFHFDGFGKVDLQDQTYDHTLDGDITYAYLQWQDWSNGLYLRVGRQFVRSGVSSEYLDGVYGDWLSPVHLGVQAFAGQQVNSDFGGKSGDWEWGARVYYRHPRFELGVSGMEAHDNDHLAFSRFGADGWLQVTDTVAINAHGFWDRVAKKWYDYQVLATWQATSALFLSADYGQVAPNLFLSHNSIFSSLFFSDIQQRELGLRADYQLTRHLTVSANARQYDYSQGGDDWTEAAEATYRWGKELENQLGVEFEHREDSKKTHVYGRYTLDVPRVTNRFDLASLFYGADFILYYFDQPIFPQNRQHYTYTATGTLGADINDHWEITVSLDYGTVANYADYTVDANGVRVPATTQVGDLGFRNSLDGSLKVVYKFF